MNAGPARREAALPPVLPVFVAPAHWRAVDFMSDLHLAEHLPALFEAWAAHLKNTPADAVFILGDLFEAWVGDDAAETGFEARCVAVLAEAAKTKRIAFMAGNRDFLVGDEMLAANGVMRLADPTIIVAFDTRVLLSHGDALCIDDEAYQRYRRIVRRPLVQRGFKALPASVRRAIGGAVRKRSAGGARATPRPLIDVDAASVLAWTRAASASALVHGHTHAPATHAVAPGIVRHVLTDWELDGHATPRAEVLRWRLEGFTRLPPDGNRAGVPRR